MKKGAPPPGWRPTAGAKRGPGNTSRGTAAGTFHVPESGRPTAEKDVGVVHRANFPEMGHGGREMDVMVSSLYPTASLASNVRSDLGGCPEQAQGDDQARQDAAGQRGAGLNYSSVIQNVLGKADSGSQSMPTDPEASRANLLERVSKADNPNLSASHQRRDPPKPWTGPSVQRHTGTGGGEGSEGEGGGGGDQAADTPIGTVKPDGTVWNGGNLILDLDSQLIDLATDWVKEGVLERFSIAGRADEGVQAWSEDLFERKGGELTTADFGAHGIELDISGTNIGDGGAKTFERLAKALKLDRTVTSLRLSRCNMGDEGADWLAGALMGNKCLTELFLVSNGITDIGCEGLAAVLERRTPLRKLILGGNQVGSTGATEFARGLKLNENLTELDLGSNKIEQEGAERLADVLGADDSMCTLARLRLEGNPIGERGHSALLTAWNRCMERKTQHIMEIQMPDQTLKSKDWVPGDVHGIGYGPEPEPFVVSCSSAGVAIGVGQRKTTIFWDQDEDEVEITYREEFLRKRDQPYVKVNFGRHTLKVAIRNQLLMDVNLFGSTRPDECTWMLGDGIMTVHLSKLEVGKWDALTRD